MSKRFFLIGIIIGFLLLGTHLSSATRIHTDTPIESELDYMIPEWDRLPFKDQRYNSSWVDYVNSVYGTSWSSPVDPRSAKCLSYGASTVNDWVKLETGMILGSYSNFISNKTENGTNPRLLEAIYHDTSPSTCWVWPTGTYCYVSSLYKDPVTKERVPFNPEGYGNLLTDPPIDWVNKADPEISSFRYNITNEDLLNGYKFKSIVPTSKNLKEALRKYGIVYIHLKVREIPVIPFPLHAITLVGYNDTDTSTDFWAHDSYNGEDFSEFSRYSIVKASEIHKAWVLYDPQWPAENHDFRRTGFTLLKGDLTTKEKAENQLNFVLDDNTGTEQVVKPTVADLDNNGFMDNVVLVHKTTFNQFTRMYGIETQKFEETKYVPVRYVTKQKWSAEQIDGGAIYFPASLGNIDSDSRKEIVTGVRNGTIYAYDVDSSGKISQKWAYYLEERFSNVAGVDILHFNGGTAIADIDLDGTNEIIFADLYDNAGDATWNGKVYVLDGSGSTAINETSYNVGNGGTYASVSVANIDDDDNPEIIVPTKYGIKVLDYNPSTNKLTEKCSNTHGYLIGSAVIYDVDRDNEYELIYVTNNAQCAAGKTCANKLYVVDANSCGGTPELEKTLTEYPRPTPTIANLDSDSQAEIIVSSVDSITPGSDTGTITAVDSSSGTTQWTYDNSGNLHPGFVSPNIADIDNNGSYNIILGENNGNTIYILNHTGGEFYKYTVSGFMDNGLAIADIDSDQLAEIVFKRAGSPTLFTSVSNENFPPELNTISNITAIAGDLIDINVTGEISAVDLENDNVDFFYSSPFNSSGLWQTTINDTGNYSILVEASDGNLSTYKFVDVIIFNETTKVVNTFSDSSTKKFLNFTQSGNLSVTVRLPKNATVIYSKITLQGQEP